MINVEMTKSSGVTLATENTICNENVKVTIANSENLIAENIKKDVQIADVVGTLESGSSDDSLLISLIQRDLTEFVIPEGVTEIASSCFSNYSVLRSVKISASVMSIGSSSFRDCTSLQRVEITNPNMNNLYQYAGSGSPFYGCSAITEFIIPQGFNANYLRIYSNNLTVDSVVNMFNALADRTNQSAYSLYLTQKVIDQLSDEEKAIPVSKNWNLVAI